MLKLDTPLITLNGIGPKFLVKLKKLGIETIKELLWHFPTRYEDFSQIYKIADLEPGQEATIQGVIKEIKGRRTWRRHLFLVEAIINDESDSIRAVWFNQPYIKNVLRPGRLANFSGKAVASENEIYLSNPTYELIDENQTSETKHTGRIVPIYPETRGLTSKGLRYLIKPVLDEIQELPEIIPLEILKNENLPLLDEALYNIHFPEILDDALSAKRRFAFEDMFFLQLHNIQQKLKLKSQKTITAEIPLQAIKTEVEKLPFELTPSQKQSLWEIIQDLNKTHPMNRLLQGDVGSGKTVIAAIAAVLMAERGYQTAFMAPTEVLAQQHYQTLSKFFPNLEKGLALLTSSTAKVFYGHDLETDVSKEWLLKEIGRINPVRNSPPQGPAGRASAGDLPAGKAGISNGVKIVIGTHALIQKNVAFQNLALVIVDEQHRFGVEQRATLTKNKKIVPHFLSMTATPIPRTLNLTLFGDLELSLITELPKNRKPIITKAIESKNRAKTYAFIHGQIKKGRQSFVICPRIEIQERGISPNWNAWQLLEVKSVKEEYEKLTKKIFPDLKIAMLHGRMKSKEKEKILKDFYEKQSDVLVSTSVIEVGIDVPNATVMMIEGAEKFGLAQLYQFRGRVGRGEHQSFCFLFTDASGHSTKQRLDSIVEAKNGMELAEKDLKIRGPGEFLGTGQTGMPDLAMKAIQNPGFVKTARNEAIKILEKDPTLKNHPALKERLCQFQKHVHWE